MVFESTRDARRADRLVEEAMAELGLSYQERPRLTEGDQAPEEKSPSEIAVERFRQEYEKRVRAANVD